MPKSSNQKLKLLYLMQMLLERSDENHPLTVQDMIDELSQHDISAERKSIYSDLEEGILSPDAFRAEVLKDSRPGCTPADVDRCMYSFLTGMDPDKAALLNELGSRYRLCLLTNNNDISMGRSHDVLESCGVDWKHLFYREFVSSHMKLLKPDPRIYNSMLAQLGTEASRILFVDDSVENVEVARSLGINALHYQVGTSLRKLVEGVLEG